MRQGGCPSVAAEVHNSSLSSRILAGEFESTMHTLLRALQSSLLTTYKSKFTQVRSSATLPIHTTLTRVRSSCSSMPARRTSPCPPLPPSASCWCGGGSICASSQHSPSSLQAEKVADAMSPPILRVAAASYLASFLVRVPSGSQAPPAAHASRQARAAFLSSAFVTSQLFVLCNWCAAVPQRLAPAHSSRHQGGRLPRSAGRAGGWRKC